VTALMAALAAAAVLGGVLLVVVGLCPVSVDELAGRPGSAPARLRRRLARSAIDGPGAARRRLLLVLAWPAGCWAGWSPA
jgi:hypothetical protein